MSGFDVEIAIKFFFYSCRIDSNSKWLGVRGRV